MATDVVILHITRVVHAARRRANVTPTPGHKWEPSGIAYGEEVVFGNSLMTTSEGTGAWTELSRLDDAFVRKTAEVIDQRF